MTGLWLWYVLAGAAGAWTGWLAWVLLGLVVRPFARYSWLLLFAAAGVLAGLGAAGLTAVAAHVSGLTPS